jgi:hypothetical protein
MAGIIPFLKDEVLFDAAHIAAMSMALDEVCKSLKLNGDVWARETVAVAEAKRGAKRRSLTGAQDRRVPRNERRGRT